MTDSVKPNKPLFELDLLKAITMVADCGSFTAAAARLCSTQSTVSQKVRRLEDMVGYKLLDRSSREAMPTDAGETLLSYARRMLAINDQLLEAMISGFATLTVRLGVPDDFVSGKTIKALVAFNRQYPQVKLEIVSGLSHDLISGYDRGELDLVLVKQRKNSRAAVACRPERMEWVDSSEHACIECDPIPLVTFPLRGLYRENMISVIEATGRRWRISFTSSSLSGIQSAVADGMGISLLPHRAVTADHVILGRKNGLQAIDVFEIAIFHRPNADPVVRELTKVLITMLEYEHDERPDTARPLRFRNRGRK